MIGPHRRIGARLAGSPTEVWPASLTAVRCEGAEMPL